MFLHLPISCIIAIGTNHKNRQRTRKARDGQWVTIAKSTEFNVVIYVIEVRFLMYWKKNDYKNDDNGGGGDDDGDDDDVDDDWNKF